MAPDRATRPASHQADRRATAGDTIAALSPSQAAACRHVWQSRDRLVLVRGAAGTGKTTLTRTALAGVGVPWVILAPSAEASRGVLRRDGFAAADTLSRFLLDADMQERVRGGLVWLDEASLAGARDVAELTRLADSLSARVVLSGDRRQHKSVARGDVLALLEDRCGLPVAEVSDVKRQYGEYKAAVEQLAAGKVQAAFARLDRLGWVRDGGPEQIADDYMAAVRDGKSVLVVSPTHAEGEAVTAAVRGRLRQAGRLTGEARTFERLVPLHLTEAERAAGGLPDGAVAVFHRACGPLRAGARVPVGDHNRDGLSGHADRYGVYRPAGIELARGDHVRVTANGRDVTGRHRLNNGATYTVAGFTAAGDIRLDNGWVVGKDFGHLAHGYAVTSHAAQGKTVDQVLIAQSSQSFPATGKEQFYVSVSRGRQQATIYTDSKDDLRAAIEREDARMTATELVRLDPRGVRSRLKRHVSWLRARASDVRRAAGPAPEPVIDLTPAHERSRHR